MKNKKVKHKFVGNWQPAIAAPYKIESSRQPAVQEEDLLKDVVPAAALFIAVEDSKNVE